MLIYMAVHSHHHALLCRVFPPQRKQISCRHDGQTQLQSFMTSLISWSCAACTLDNPPTFLACAACSAPRQSTDTTEVLYHAEAVEQDARRPELFRELSETGKQLFHSAAAASSFTNAFPSSVDSSSSTSYAPQCGDIVHARYWEDSKFYPAEIVRERRDEGDLSYYRVRFIDFDDSYEWVNVSEVGPALPRDLQEVEEAFVGDDTATSSDAAGFLVADSHSIGKRIGGGSRNGRRHRTKPRTRSSSNAPLHQLPRRLLSTNAVAVVMLLTGKNFELFKIGGSSLSVQRIVRLSPTGGVAPAAASRRGGQSALRFSRLADAARSRWVKRCIQALNESMAPSLDKHPVAAIIVCGATGLKTLLKSRTDDVDHRLRSSLHFLASDIDPACLGNERLRKVNVSNAISGGKMKKVSTTLLDFEVVDVVASVLGG